MKTIDKLLYLTFILLLHISFNSIAQNDTERQKILDTLQLKTLLVDTVVHPIYGITQSYELDTLLTRELALTHQEFVKHLKDDMGFVQYDSLALEKTRVVPPNKHGLPSNKVIHIYMLYYKGVPLYNHKIRIEQFKEIITVVNIPKEIPLNLEGLDVEPKLSHEVAIEIALNKANLRTYIWDKYANRAEDNNGNLVDKETLKKKLLQKEIYLYVPHKEDIISLVYKLNISGSTKEYKSFSKTYFIDAHSGIFRGTKNHINHLANDCFYCNNSIVNTIEDCAEPINCNCTTPSSINTLSLPTYYYECQEVTINVCSSDNVAELIENTVENENISVRDGRNPNFNPPNIDYEYITLCYDEPAQQYLLSEANKVEIAAYWGGEKVYQYFQTKNINSYDNMGSELEIVVHDYDTDEFGNPLAFSGAIWREELKKIFLGDGKEGENTPMGTLDIIAHEYTHAVLNNYYKIVDNNVIEPESGGIHEGLADIMSVLVRQNTDNFNEPIEWKWQIGDLIQIGDGSADKDFPRKLHNPHDQENPQAMYYGSDEYEGVNLWNGNKYDMAGVLAYWFYLLTEGGVGIKGLPVEGSIDLSISESILFETLNQLKPADNTPDKAPSFVEFCDAAIAAATVLYGECSDNVVRVANAFAAVGLVKTDFTCDGYLGACVDMIEIDFALTPEDCLNDPNFDPNGGWQDNVPFGEWIVAQDASSGNGLTYEWTTDPDDLPSSDPEPGECTPSSDACKRFRWFVAGPKDITLTITDANGCIAVQTKTITVIDDTNFDCELAFDIVPIQPYTQCNDVTSICADSNTGQITLIPNEFYLGDISCYNFELINSSGIMIDDTPIIYANGSVIFECLPPDDYDIDIYNDMYDCIVHPITTLNPVSAPSEVIVPYQENSYYSVSFGNGDLCEGVAEIVAINGENMATAYHYNFVWDDCNTEECNTYIRTDLCAGLYTITATNSLTGCSYIYEFEIDYRNRLQTFINVVLEGTVVANNSDGLMNTYARQANLIPTEQPYNSLPWDYYGTESVADTSEIPQTAVDWILVEVRHEADTTQIAGRAAGFLLRDGNIVGADGSPLRILNLLENEKYYVIVRHRNHLAISSRNSITLPNTEPTKYDFTTSIMQAKGNEQMRELQSGKYAMCAGDANADGKINITDYQIYLDESSSINSYLPADFDINTHTTARDFNLMLGNNGAIGIDWIRYE